MLLTIFLTTSILDIYQRERKVITMDSFTALLLASLGTVFILVIGWYILQVIAYWKIFEKANEPGWKAIIPFYNTYTQYKFTWNTRAFWIVLIGGIVGGILQETTEGIPSLLGTLIMLIVAIFNIISLNKLAKAFGHGVGFTIGLFFLNPIFMLILGFGRDEYIGPQ